jgi:hypothetical protein
MLMAILCLQIAFEDSPPRPLPPSLAMTSRCSLTLLCALVLSPAPVLAEGMLLPGWAPVAEQALGDIRATAAQSQPNVPEGPASPVRPGTAKPVVDAFIAAQSLPASEREADTRVDELIGPLWRASAGQGAGQAKGADRVVQAFSLSNATEQLASSVYGGPPGAIAYATWWAYQQPGASPQQALSVGLLAGAGLWASHKEASGVDVPPQVAQQTSLAAAMGGLAVAAAGGDEQALRGLFFDAGAALLVQDGSRVYCLSGTVQCQRPPAKAAVYSKGQLQGWALDQLAPALAAANPALAPMMAQTATASPVVRTAGALSLAQGWTLIWQFPETVSPGLLYPSVALTRGPAPVPTPAPVPSEAPAPLTASTRYQCEKGSDIRVIWTVPGGPKVGYVCQTLYQIDQTRAVLWNARQNPEMCDSKARAQVSREQAHGYQCKPVEGQR